MSSCRFQLQYRAPAGWSTQHSLAGFLYVVHVVSSLNIGLPQGGVLNIAWLVSSMSLMSFPAPISAGLPQGGVLVLSPRIEPESYLDRMVDSLVYSGDDGMRM